MWIARTNRRSAETRRVSQEIFLGNNQSAYQMLRCARLYSVLPTVDPLWLFSVTPFAVDRTMLSTQTTHSDDQCSLVCKNVSAAENTSQ
jgi:hypothetical protein